MIYAADYVIPITADHIENGAVLVQDGKIVEVGTLEELSAKHPAEPVRDFGRAALMPGFVDVHTHLEYAAMRGMIETSAYSEWKREILRREPLMSEQDWNDSAELGALEAVASGVTCVADITSTGAAARAINKIGLRGVVYRELYAMHPDEVAAALEEGDATLQEWEQTFDTSRMHFGLAPDVVYTCHPRLYQAISDYANEHNVPVALHIAGSNEEANFIRYGSSPFSVHATEQERGFGIDMPPWLPAGCTPVRYVYNWGILDVPQVLAVHCVHVDEDDLRILHDCNVSIAHCPRINAKLGMGVAPVSEFLDKGITVAIGTDSPAATHTFDMIEETRFALMMMRALSGTQRQRAAASQGKVVGFDAPAAHLQKARDALAMATIEGARALGLEDQIGSLEPGKQADIIAIDLHNSHTNPISKPHAAIAYSTNQDNVMMTMVGGRVVYDNFRHVSGVDRDRVAAVTKALRARLQEGATREELVAHLRESHPEAAARFTR